MAVYVLDRIGLVPEELMAVAAGALPEERLEKARKYRYEKDRRASILAFWLLICGMKEEHGITALPEIGISERGKPFFRDSGICFNLSHSADCVCCGIAGCKIGVDIEQQVTQYEELLDYTMSREEREQIQKAPRPREAFTRLWTLKESYLKCTGQGLTDALGTIDFAGCEGDTFRKYGHCFTTAGMEGCHVSVCTEEGHPRIIRSGAEEFLRRYTDAG